MSSFKFSLFFKPGFHANFSQNFLANSLFRDFDFLNKNLLETVSPKTIRFHEVVILREIIFKKLTCR